jgi:hypothetical protein
MLAVEHASQSILFSLTVVHFVTKIYFNLKLPSPYSNCLSFKIPYAFYCLSDRIYMSLSRVSQSRSHDPKNTLCSCAEIMKFLLRIRFSERCVLLPYKRWPPLRCSVFFLYFLNFKFPVLPLLTLPSVCHLTAIQRRPYLSIF